MQALGGCAACWSRAGDPEIVGDPESFYPSKTFKGSRKGYDFRLGEEGLGYYLHEIGDNVKAAPVVLQWRSTTILAAGIWLTPEAAAAWDKAKAEDAAEA